MNLCVFIGHSYTRSTSHWQPLIVTSDPHNMTSHDLFLFGSFPLLNTTNTNPNLIIMDVNGAKIFTLEFDIPNQMLTLRDYTNVRTKFIFNMH